MSICSCVNTALTRIYLFFFFFSLTGRFGSATASYFRFTRWLVFLNFYTFLVSFLVIVMPFFASSSPSLFIEGLDKGNPQPIVNESIHVNQAINCSVTYITTIDNYTSTEDWQDEVLDFFVGTVCIYFTGLISVSVSAQAGIIVLRKAHTHSAPSLCSVPKVAIKTVPMFVRLNTDHSQPQRVEYWPLPFSIPFFLQAVSAVMLWPDHVQTGLQASLHFSPAKLQRGGEGACACMNVCRCVFMYVRKRE